MKVGGCFENSRSRFLKLVDLIVNNYGNNHYKKKEHNQHSSLL